MKTAGFLTIGNEILSGSVQDINFYNIAQTYTHHGINFLEHRTVRDEQDAIVFAINEMRFKYDFVFTGGGIGPTHDDITVEAVAKVFGVQTVQNPEALKILKDYYTQKNDPFTKSRQKMAYVPQGAFLIPNSMNCVPGFGIANVFCLAGVPEVFVVMAEAILNYISKGPVMHSEEILLDMPESQIADKLSEIAQEFSKKVEIGSYPNLRTQQTKIVIRSINKEFITLVLDKVIGALLVNRTTNK
jgi:molybdenum cofactor synthesis domain-containing protein